jgi:hypothetical protein
MRNVMIFLFLLVLPLGLTSACSHVVPATVTAMPQVPIDKGANIFVVAQAQRDRIVKSLVDAGLNVSDEWAVDDYSLTVSVGRWRGSSGCSGVSNVAYVLNDAGRRLMVIKGRGATDDCVPNVFDDMSRLLAVYAAER